MKSKSLFIFLPVLLSSACSPVNHSPAPVTLSHKPLTPYQVPDAISRMLKDGPVNKFGLKIQSAGSDLLGDAGLNPAFWITRPAGASFDTFAKADFTRGAYPNYGILNRSADILYSKQYGCYNISSSYSGPGKVSLMATLHEFSANSNASANFTVVVNGTAVYNPGGNLTASAIKPGRPQQFIGMGDSKQFSNFGLLEVPVTISSSNEVCIGNNSSNSDEWAGIQLVELKPDSVTDTNVLRYFDPGTYQSASAFVESVQGNAQADLLLEAKAYPAYGQDEASDIAYTGQKLAYTPSFQSAPANTSGVIKIRGAFEDNLSTTIGDVTVYPNARKIIVLLNGKRVYAGEPFPVGGPNFNTNPPPYIFTNNAEISIPVDNLQKDNQLYILNQGIGWLAVDNISLRQDAGAVTPTESTADISFGDSATSPVKYVTATAPVTTLNPGESTTITANAFNNPGSQVPDTTSSDKWTWSLSQYSPYKGYLNYDGSSNTATYTAAGAAGPVTVTALSKLTGKKATIVMNVADVLPKVQTITPADAALTLPSAADTVSNISFTGTKAFSVTFRDDNGEWVQPSFLTMAYERSLGLSGTGISTNVPAANADNYDVYIGGFANSPSSNYFYTWSYTLSQDKKDFTISPSFTSLGPKTGYIIFNGRQGGTVKRRHRYNITIN